MSGFDVGLEVVLDILAMASGGLFAWMMWDMGDEDDD